MWNEISKRFPKKVVWLGRWYLYIVSKLHRIENSTQCTFLLELFFVYTFLLLGIKMGKKELFILVFEFIPFSKSMILRKAFLMRNIFQICKLFVSTKNFLLQVRIDQEQTFSVIYTFSSRKSYSSAKL